MNSFIFCKIIKFFENIVLKIKPIYFFAYHCTRTVITKSEKGLTFKVHTCIVKTDTLIVVQSGYLQLISFN